jgi:hypothetical protein
MALEMRDHCEKCTKELHNKSDAYICTHECTFCHECTDDMDYVCPNCRGELVKRPRMGEVSLSCATGS